MQAFSKLKARLGKGPPPRSKEPIPPVSAASTTPGPGATTSTTSTASSAAKPSSHVIPRQLPVQSWPIRLESPRYKIQVTVYHYLVARLSNIASQTVTELYAWTFISSGLQAVAGGELVLVIQRRSNEAPDSYPTDFLRICDTVYDRASTQRLVLKRWKLIDFDEMLFNRPDFKTIALGFRNSPLFGLNSVALDKNPIPHFYCLALSDQEAAAARKGGVLRALVSAEGSSSWFPFPFFVDRDRKVALTASSMDSSVVASSEFSKLEVDGLNVIHADSGQVTLNIPQDRVAEFKAAMVRKRTAPISSLLIVADMHDACQCVYMWTPGKQAVVRTMTKENKTNIAANFLLLSFNQASESVRLVEDGILVLLNSANTTRFFQAACEGRDETLKPGNVPFRVSWPPYWPVPAFSNISGAAGTLYLPAGGHVVQPYEKDHVKVDSIVLLHEPRSGTANISLMADFTKKAEAAIIAAIPPQKPALLPQGCGMIAQFRIPKTAANSFQVKFLLPSQAALSAVPMNELQEVVNRLEVPEGMVYGDYMEWQIRFSCWGFEWSMIH